MNEVNKRTNFQIEFRFFFLCFGFHWKSHWPSISFGRTMRRLRMNFRFPSFREILCLLRSNVFSFDFGVSTSFGAMTMMFGYWGGQVVASSSLDADFSQFAFDGNPTTMVSRRPWPVLKSNWTSKAIKTMFCVVVALIFVAFCRPSDSWIEKKGFTDRASAF